MWGLIQFFAIRVQKLIVCLLSLTTKNEDALQPGFKNWKQALEKFNEHQKSARHRHAVQQLQHIKSGPAAAQKAADQASARAAFLAVFGSIGYLARQGLALRGQEDSPGNLMQLLELHSEDSQPLRSQLPRTKFLSPDSQNEVLDLLVYGIQQVIVNAVQSSKQFGVIVDGTQDSSGHEQVTVY